jgi:large subunit ribosomal protein L15e
VLNSYWVAQDSAHKFYEVILIDPMHKVIRDDPRINWLCAPAMKHRELRGLTSAGRQHRGLRKKGHKSNHMRPSVRATWKAHNTQSLRRYR